MTLDIDVETRLRQHMQRVRAEVSPPHALESNILKALDASIARRSRQSLPRQLVVTFALVALAIVLVIALPYLRALSQPGGTGAIKPLVMPCHLPSWIPEPVKSAVFAASRCRAEANVKQLDQLAVQETAVGTSLTRAFPLVDGRYTVFIFEDPPQCVRSFQLVDRQQRGVQAAWEFEPVLAGGLRVPLVQQDVPGEVYRMQIGTAGAGCSWMAQVVLNSMLFEGNPPHPWRSPSPLPAAITIKKGDDGTFRVGQIGFYAINWTTSPQACSYSLDLKATDGRLVHMGDGSPRGTMRNNLPQFMGASTWSVIMTGDCPVSYTHLTLPTKA